MDTSKKLPLLIITGPTAVGKTKASVEAALRLNGEIISADSMQVYRHMDIGTAKVTEDEKKGVRHWLIDEFEPDDEFNVTIFKSLCEKYIQDIHSRGKLPIIAGGTGFYIQSVLYDIQFTEYDDEKKDSLLAELELQLRESGEDVMFGRLREIDPEYAAVIHKNNTRRVLNGICFYMLTGKRLSEHNAEQQLRESPYDFRYIVINDSRDLLYERINRRVDKMFEDGLEEEVRGLLEKGYSRSLPSMLGLGYKETADYLCNECTKEEAIEILKRDTRHFAKKQLTWFKREKNVIEINRQEYKSEDEIIGHIVSIAAELVSDV